MKNRSIYLILLLTTLVNILVSCGIDEAEADGGYRLVFMFERRCITNDVSIWCD